MMSFVTTPEGRYRGRVRVLNVAPGIIARFSRWLVSVVAGRPLQSRHVASLPRSRMKPIPPSRGSSRTVVKVLAAGFRRAQIGASHS